MERTEEQEAALRGFGAKAIKSSTLFDHIARTKGAALPQAVKIDAARSGPGEDANLGESHPLRVLVAEDNPVNQKVARLILMKLGYSADLVANGLEAVDAVARQPYDVVFMDMQMPEMDGLEAMRAIRTRRPKGDGPRLVALTANAMPEDRAACMEAGADDYLCKPVSQRALATALRAAKRVENRGRGDGAGAVAAGDAARGAGLSGAATGAGVSIVDVELLRREALPLIKRLRKAADMADAAAGVAAARELVAVSERCGAVSLLETLRAVEGMEADRFGKEGIVFAARVQRLFEAVGRPGQLSQSRVKT